VLNDPNSAIDITTLTDPSDRSTALHVAAYHGHSELIELFIRMSNKAKMQHHSKSSLIPFLDAVNQWNQTAIQLAAQRGHAHTVLALAEAGAHVNHADEVC
jgi:ankyrin repeat protein